MEKWKIQKWKKMKNGTFWKMTNCKMETNIDESIKKSLKYICPLQDKLKILKSNRGCDNDDKDAPCHLE